MANKVKFELNREGVKTLMKSNEMMSVCKNYANAALGRLGSGYEVTTHVGKTRVNAEVAAATYAAKVENMNDNTILKAIRG